MSFVTIQGSSKRERKYQSLTVEEFQRFTEKLSREPFRTITLVQAFTGLRISECLALRWYDVDWLNAKLTVARGIVRQRVGETKTEYSRNSLPIDHELVEVLKTRRNQTQFGSDSDWIFASPAKLGRLPWSYDQVQRQVRMAAEAANIAFKSGEIFGTHSMRNSFRSYLDAVGAPLSVQQKLMRHGDIRTTMNTYGDVITDAARSPLESGSDGSAETELICE